MLNYIVIALVADFLTESTSLRRLAGEIICRVIVTLPPARAHFNGSVAADCT